MTQKAVLAGFVTAISALFVFNLSSHTGEAAFLLGKLSVLRGDFERSEIMFRRAAKDAGSGSSLKDRANVAAGSSLVAQGEYENAVRTLLKSNDRAEGKEKEILDSERAYALGIARAHTALTNTGELRKMQLQSSLDSFSGAYRLSGDEDALANYEIVKKLLDEEKEKENRKTEEQEKKKDEENTKKEEEKPKKEEEKEDRKPDGKSEKKEEGKPEQREKGASGGENEKQGNWTNSGDPQNLQNDPGGTNASNESKPLSDNERDELKQALDSLGKLQEERNKYVRPDGNRQSDGSVPNSLRELFFGDSFFENMLPDAETGPNGKSW